MKKMNGRYLPQPDRIIIEVPTDKERAYQFLFTRRITEKMMAELMPLLKKAEANKAPLKPKKKDTKKPTPLESSAPQPKLVIKFLLRPSLEEKLDSFNLNLEFADQTKMNLVISYRFINNLFEIFNTLQKKAGWAIHTNKSKLLSQASTTSYLDKKKLH
jgi:hypothetical protein